MDDYEVELAPAGGGIDDKGDINKIFNKAAKELKEARERRAEERKRDEKSDIHIDSDHVSKRLADTQRRLFGDGSGGHSGSDGDQYGG